MKIYFVLATLLILTACDDSKNASDLARQTVLDSVKSVNRANDVKLETIDSMNKVNANTPHHGIRQVENVQSAPVNTATTESVDKKKKMSNAKKGTLIGAGAGVVGGAIVGAATSKDKGKGAVIGGIIGGAVGAGAGYGIGKNKDNKKDTIR